METWRNRNAVRVQVFGEEVRPVKLRTVVRGYNPSKVDFLFERRLNEYIVGVVREFSGGKPALVFVKCVRPALALALQ